MRIRALELPTGDYILVVDRVDTDPEYFRRIVDGMDGIQKKVKGCAGLVFFSEEVELDGSGFNRDPEKCYPCKELASTGGCFCPIGVTASG